MRKTLGLQERNLLIHELDVSGESSVGLFHARSNATKMGMG